MATFSGTPATVTRLRTALRLRSWIASPSYLYHGQPSSSSGSTSVRVPCPQAAQAFCHSTLRFVSSKARRRTIFEADDSYIKEKARAPRSQAHKGGTNMEKHGHL